MAVIAGLGLLTLGQGLTFFADEWAVIEGRSLDLGSFIRPFNEHWLGLTVAAYRLVFDAIGFVSYAPYLVLLVVLHVVVAAEVFVLVRRSAGPVVGFAAGLVMLFFGSGFENLFWAMQIGFVGAAALGFGAMMAMDRRPLDATLISRRRATLATALLTLAVMTSGLGLVMVAAVGVELLVDRTRRRYIAVAVVPALTYLAWLLAVGRAGVATARDPFTLEALVQVPAFVIRGAGAAAGAISGTGPIVGVGLIVMVVAAVVWRVVRGGHLHPRIVGCLGGVVVLYLLTGLIRAQLEADAALYTRYTYLAGALLLVALGALIGRDFDRLMAIPGPRRAAVAVAAVVVALSLAWNVQLLIAGRSLFLERAERTRALVMLALEPLPPGVEPDRTLILVPSPASLARLIAEHGSPLADPLVVGGIRQPSDAALADALRRLVERKGVIGALPQ